MGMSTNRIKQLRIEKGLTLGQLAEKVGLSESHLSRVEAGVRGVKLSKLGALAKVLGVPMIELMPQESFEHASDLTPYVPPKGSAVEKALASSSQRMFRVLSGVLRELEINENDLIIADCSPNAQYATGPRCPQIRCPRIRLAAFAPRQHAGRLLRLRLWWRKSPNMNLQTCRPSPGHVRRFRNALLP